MIKTLTNPQTGSKGLSKNIEAAKHNSLLKKYFNKNKKAKAKKNEETERQKE
ncbi:MAG: phospholipid/cholesterol/gamma-HCH transport system substrate-binding protein [Flavobacterium sp.]|jgi:phospholipid/cholesterol/gamma-HCH transport system substrate-binding protein